MLSVQPALEPLWSVLDNDELRLANVAHVDLGTTPQTTRVRGLSERHAAPPGQASPLLTSASNPTLSLYVFRLHTMFSCML